MNKFKPKFIARRTYMPLFNRMCEECFREFVVTTMRKTYCSKACGAKAKNRRRKL